MGNVDLILWKYNNNNAIRETEVSSVNQVVDCS